MYMSPLSPFHCLLLLLFSIKHGPVKYHTLVGYVIESTGKVGILYT